MSANSAAAHDLVPIDRRLIDALQNREQRLAQAQRVDLVGSWEWDIAADAVHWSDAVCRIFGSPTGELERTYRDALERLHPDDRDVLVRLVSRSLETRCAWTHRHRIVRPGGEVRHVETRGEVIADGDGGVVTMRGTIRDRSESVLLERQFHDVSAALELVRLTASAVHDAPDIEAALRSTLDVVCGAQRRWIGRVWQVRASSPGGLVATGLVSGSSAETWPAPSPLASLALEHREPRALPAVDANGPVVLAAPIEVGPEILYVVEFEGEQPVADLDLLVAAVRSVCSILAQRIGRDIAAVNEALSHDPLTGLSTRTVFLEQVQRALAFGQRNGSATVVFSVDLDDFHRVNDEHGHEGGDKVLVAVANRLRRSLRQHDTVARGSSAITRVGGDEFLMMCETVRDEAAALVIATRLLGTVALPIELDSGEVVVSARIGISMSAIDSKPRQMVIEAEAAQRHAKELGGAHQFFAPEHHQRAAAHAALVEALHRAVAAEEMRLFYQPKISLATNRIVGVEALLRWEHPQRGLVMPDEFIPAAEQSGLVIPISAWVLRESLRQAAVWHQAYPRTPLRLAVNVSARQFRAELPGIISAAIDEAGISATSVCLEMTETTIMDDIDSTVAILEELKELGLTVSIDDFGTGYSSLEYLHRMPIDEVKIDRSFVAGLGSDAVNTAIVASVISLAHAMNLEVVAEGVETLEQLERLRTLGCDFAQGYYIARPMPPAEIDDHLAGDAAGEELPRADPARGVAGRPLSETVLVVDDAADVRMLARMSLTAAGFTVEEAGNGAAALALARRLNPRCVLLDVSLPDMSGIDVCRALRTDPATTGCTIVMLTTHADSADKAEAFLVGADDYIVKPFAPRDLVARVHAAVRRRQTTTGAVGRQVDDALHEMLRIVRERELGEGVALAGAGQLSSRQVEIVKRLLAGDRVPAIARDLFLSQSTVRNHLSVIYGRLGVHSQEELLVLLRKKSTGQRTASVAL